MNDIMCIVVVLVELYVVLGVMLIGFGYMFAGKFGGARAARFYFGRSSQWMFRHASMLVRTVLITLWGAFVLWIGRPLAHALLRWLQWLATRERGWLRPSR